MRFENDLLSFELPASWEVEEDGEGNIRCWAPDDPDVWLQVELGGVRKPGGEGIEAASFLSDCYASEISAGTASLTKLDPRTAVVRRSIALEHGGQPYVVSYCHLGHNPAPDNLQMTQFGLAYPAQRGSLPNHAELVAFADRAARTAILKPWLSEE